MSKWHGFDPPTTEEQLKSLQRQMEDVMKRLDALEQESIPRRKLRTERPE